jgi:hypothetical protein
MRYAFFLFPTGATCLLHVIIMFGEEYRVCQSVLNMGLLSTFYSLASPSFLAEILCYYKRLCLLIGIIWTTNLITEIRSIRKLEVLYSR